jgi:CheY-like chemotaxis protein
VRSKQWEGRNSAGRASVARDDSRSRDSKFLPLTAERALARAGNEVSTAIDGKSALQMAREKMPDVILLHRLLLKLTGTDVLKALNKDPATTGIAVVVLGLSYKNAGRVRQDGARAFLGEIGTGAGQGLRHIAGSAGGDCAKAEAGGSAVPLAAKCGG